MQNAHPMEHTRQQNYLFTYNIVPAFLFRSDFAWQIAGFYPNGFLYFQKQWTSMARLFPPEHVVSDEPLKTEAYQLSDGVYCLLVYMPPSERILEVQFMAIVLQPKVRYFVAGQGVIPGDSNRLTVREVTVHGHERCGSTLTDGNSFLLNVVRILNVQPSIRLAEEEEMLACSEQIERFEPKFQATSPNASYGVAATYKVMSRLVGDTSGFPVAAVQQFYAMGGEQVHRAVASILAQDDAGFELAIKDIERNQEASSGRKSIWRIEMSLQDSFKFLLAGLACIGLGVVFIVVRLQGMRNMGVGPYGGPISMVVGLAITTVAVISLVKALKNAKPYGSTNWIRGKSVN